jgi:hypothetical protein
MGRSVSYPSNALIVTFNTIQYYYEAEEYDVEAGVATEIGEEIENPCAWDDLLEDFVNACEECWPSLNLDIKWLDREDQALLSNRLVRIGISEYCGMVAYWVVPNEQNPECFTLAQRWATQIEEVFVRKFGGYNKVGSMSNGGGVYQKITH